MKNLTALIISIAFLFPGISFAQFTYDEIAKRHKESSLKQEVVDAAKIQGECLVGLKELNFKKEEKFDPVAEWTSYRSGSLLEQYSPCEVLIIMEVAQEILKSNNETK